MDVMGLESTSFCMASLRGVRQQKPAVSSGFEVGAGRFELPTSSPPDVADAGQGETEEDESA